MRPGLGGDAKTFKLTSPLLTKALVAFNHPLVVQRYVLFGTSDSEAMVLEEQEVLTGMALYWWVVFVLWETRRDWK